MFFSIYKTLSRSMTRPKFKPLVSVPVKANNDFERTKRLGNGTFAEVYAVTKRKGGRNTFSRVNAYRFAAKIFSFEVNEDGSLGCLQRVLGDERFPTDYVNEHDQEDISDCLAEINVLRRLSKGRNRDSFVINYVTTFQFKNELWVITEQLEACLYDVVSTQPEGTTLGITKSAIIVQEVLQALKYLRDRRIIHRDIKPGNILFSRLGKIKLCDMGISVVVPETEDHCVVDCICGTRDYMASELFHPGQEYDYSVDLWSLGIVLFYCCFGQTPFQHIVTEGWEDEYWVEYDESEAHYARAMFGTRFLTFKEVVFTDDADTAREYKKDHEKIKEIAAVVRSCTIPYPKHGIEGTIKRPNMRDRITIDEFMAWTEEVLKGKMEFTKRQAMITEVKRCRSVINDREEQERQELLSGTMSVAGITI